MTEQICENCRWWRMKPGKQVQMEDTGTCHYEPPRVFWDWGSKETVTCVPDSWASAFCSRFQAARSPEDRFQDEIRVKGRPEEEA